MASSTPNGRSLAARGNVLARPAEQVRLLEAPGSLPAFADHLRTRGLQPLSAAGLQVLQINVGRLCNQTCLHCHVDAGPDRTEIMSREVMEKCLQLARRGAFRVIDITGGAPELNPHFRWLVEEAHGLGCQVIDRCNLTVLLLPRSQGLIEFLARHEVEIVASLPCYLPRNTDAQRGAGVFERSMAALKALNQAGYGVAGSPLKLNLVANATGAKLPPAQAALEQEVRRELQQRHGVTFHQLYTLTNLPISRFLESLIAEGDYQAYMDLLVQSFNRETVSMLMCRDTVSVSWDGRLYDCDFNQMLDRPLMACGGSRVEDVDVRRLARRPIVTGRHCFGCTAGAGSSCGGSLV